MSELCKLDPWLVWNPPSKDHPQGIWFNFFPADLAAKYWCQGCAVRLIGSEKELRTLTVPAGRYVEPDPDGPPYSPAEIVWQERASRYSDAYLPQWERISEWLEALGYCVPVVVRKYRRELGEWGGKTDLVALDAARPAAAPLFEQSDIPF